MSYLLLRYHWGFHRYIPLFVGIKSELVAYSNKYYPNDTNLYVQDITLTGELAPDNTPYSKWILEA